MLKRVDRSGEFKMAPCCADGRAGATAMSPSAPWS
jgi:hypothetical protein